MERGFRMTVLIGSRLRDTLRKDVVVHPLFDKKQVGASSVDLRLGCIFRLSERTREHIVDPRDFRLSADDTQRAVYVPFSEAFVLHPWAFALAVTLEYVRLSEGTFGIIEGRSSPGRTGLLAVTAGAVHPEFSGCPTLELVNAGETPLLLRPGDLVAQLILFSTEGNLQEEDEEFGGIPEPSRYQISIEPQASRWKGDFQKDRLLSAWLRGASSQRQDGTISAP